MRITSVVMANLGFTGQFTTVDRLAAAGFIEIVKCAPQTKLLNVDSWFRHLKRCADDPEFWAEGKGNIEEYRKYI